MASSKLQMAKRLEGTDKNVWVEFGRLTVENKALNLGQGFPDFFPPDYVRDGLLKSVSDENPFLQQYTRSYGHPRLIKALADTYSPIMKREIDPLSEILVTVGAYGSLFCTVQGLLNPGEEAIIIEPYFDCYEPMVKVAGGTPVFVPLRPTKTGTTLSSADWKLDPKELESKFSNKTKLLFLNNPNNPVGKVYSLEELEMIADLCIKYDIICVADEVYEWMIYPEYKHLKIATLPGMWERTITIGSAGKTFSVTGWKLGWSVGPKNLIHALQTMHQNSVYTCPTPIQEAVARGFELENARFGQKDCYFQSLAEELMPKRDRMGAFLAEAGMVPTVPEGGYFMIADFSKLDVKSDPNNNESKDFQFVKWLIKNKKVAGIPPSAFYSQEHKHLAENLIRFCFIKEDKTLDQAGEILKQWRKELST